MKKSELTELLRFMSTLDNRIVDEDRVEGWFVLLHDVDKSEAAQVVVDHYKTTRDYLTPLDILDGIKRLNRRMPKQIEADVRSARARGLIGRDWPETDPLPADVMARLTAARSSDRDTSERLSLAQEGEKTIAELVERTGRRLPSGSDGVF